jgi:hypothetical protein
MDWYAAMAVGVQNRIVCFEVMVHVIVGGRIASFFNIDMHVHIHINIDC